jgi:hypothetical protein
MRAVKPEGPNARIDESGLRRNLERYGRQTIADDHVRVLEECGEEP